MEINASGVLLSSSWSRLEMYSREERLTIWDRRAQQGRPTATGAADALDISAEARALQAAALEREEEIQEVVYPEREKLKGEVLLKLLEVLTGKKFEIHSANLARYRHRTEPQNGQPAPAPEGWGVEYYARESYLEQEQMTFTATGLVKTADGKEISFTVELAVSREFAAHHEIIFRAGEAVAVDPLVINFGGNSAGLSEEKFFFDLTGDGVEEQIALLQPGSGYLAIDANGDGIVNDGSELFGPTTGNGFTELAAYDADGNSWIDSGDPIFAQLRIWARDSGGQDQLYNLQEKGISALYLGYINTPYSLKGSNNQLLGYIRNSSIYLQENGTAGTVQQLDLVV